MENLNSTFWLGLAAAIPFSIVANLLTPKIQQWLSRRSETKFAKRVAELREEYERIENLTKNPHALNSYLLQQILVITFFTSVLLALAGVFSIAGSACLALRWLASFENGVEVGGAIMVAKICIDAIRDTNRVRDFDRYKAQIESEIGKIE